MTKIKQDKMILLPPAAHLCQECAVDHLPDQPHNAQSMFYRTKFAMENNKKSPTWLDAISHCSKEVREFWMNELKAKDIDVEGGKIFPRKYYKE